MGIKVFSMFSGIGGFEYGMQQSKHDFEIIGHSEIDKYANQIYDKHFKGVTNYGDATKIDPGTLPDFDLLVGGFPCQAFSVAGLRQGLDDTRGTLFFDIARILDYKRPRNFLLENVKGLLSHDSGKTFQTMSLNGRYLTAKISESPRIGKECSLSDILEEEVEDKYFLSHEMSQKLMHDV